MNDHLIFWLGILAAGLTSLSYLPQVQKALPRGATKDLSVKTLIALTAGLCCWVAYGALKQDIIIIVANSIGAALAATTLACKLRDIRD
jgi:MtN3 and saliva related transmembrane protein